MKSSFESHPGVVSDESARPMRILHVIYSFMIGGSEQLVLTLVRSMPRFEHGVVAVDLGGTLEKEFRGAGAVTWNLDRIQCGRVSATSRLRRIIREFQPDSVHSHHLHELIYAVPAIVGSTARVIHTEHEFYSLTTTKARLLLRVLSIRCDAVTGVDEETVQYLRHAVGIPERKLALVRNGIAIESFRRPGTNRGAFDLDDADLVVGIVARLEPVKGHAVLLAAFASLLARFPNAKLLVVGEGSQMSRLQDLARDLGIEQAIRWLGARRDVPEILSSLDVFVLCSLEEGLPMSLLEAMAAARPVAATSVGGIPKLLRDGVNGLLMPPGDVNAAAEALERLLGDAHLRRALGTAGAKTVEDAYSLSDTVTRYEDLYYDRTRHDQI